MVEPRTAIVRFYLTADLRKVVASEEIEFRFGQRGEEEVDLAGAVGFQFADIVKSFPPGSEDPQWDLVNLSGVFWHPKANIATAEEHLASCAEDAIDLRELLGVPAGRYVLRLIFNHPSGLEARLFFPCHADDRVLRDPTETEDDVSDNDSDMKEGEGLGGSKN